MATLDLAAVMARALDGTILFWSAGCERLYQRVEEIGFQAGWLGSMLRASAAV
jgi:hypothetical protein